MLTLSMTLLIAWGLLSVMNSVGLFYLCFMDPEVQEGRALKKAEKKLGVQPEKEDKSFSWKSSSEWLFLNSSLFAIVFVPISHVFGSLFLFSEIKKMIIENREKKEKRVERYLSRMNELLECRECGMLQRRHQLLSEHYTHCCGDTHRKTMKEVSNEKFYKFASTSPDLLEMGHEDALEAILSSDKRKREQLLSKIEKQTKAKMKQETQAKIEGLLEQTRFIQKQSELHIEKEYRKLETMNTEKEKRKKVVLDMLEGHQKEEFVKAIQLFDKLKAIEKKKLEVFKQTTEKKIASLEEEIQKLA